MKNRILKLKFRYLTELRAFIDKVTPSYGTRKKLLFNVQHCGTNALGWVLLCLTRVLSLGQKKGLDFRSISTTRWTRPVNYCSKIAGIDKALKDGYTPEEAFDNCAREAGHEVTKISCADGDKALRNSFVSVGPVADIDMDITKEIPKEPPFDLAFVDPDKKEGGALECPEDILTFNSAFVDPDKKECETVLTPETQEETLARFAKDWLDSRPK